MQQMIRHRLTHARASANAALDVALREQLVERRDDRVARHAEVRRERAGGRKSESASEPPRENARLLGAIVTTDKFGYFLKMVGPDKTMTSIRPAFEDLLKSIEVED